MKNMKKSIKLFTILLAAGILLAVIIFLSRNAPQNQPTKQEKLKIAYFKEMVGAPYFVAKESGIFEKNDLDVELIEVEAKQVLNELITGRADITIGVSWPSIIGMEIENPGLLKGFGSGGETIDGEVVEGILAREDSDMKNLMDLKGKTIAGDNARNNLALEMVFKKIGLNPSEDVKIIEIGKDIIGQALATKQVDAIFVLQPSLTVIKKMGVKILDTNIRAKNIIDPYWSGVLGVTTAKFASENNGAIEKLFSALDEAVKYIRANPGKAKLISSEYTSLPEDIASKAGIYFFASPKEYIDFEKAQIVVSSFVEAGILKESVDVKNVFLLP
ncbi:hypothetical protein A2Y83_00890 [Candidatus Falkowbacteria bacterium RBG_13_39_14]|uniref:SsuA/THI5-like domain-containing protein n=1 Tax=Candidatus Falkowbacteria bacterium RBG_13_39_14 TaxID=1797985 RepID=A0A1F5S5D9_9BACT|nr:MAG: hypothetical protein A2Y83_00890 [Candidatus Falkowbacteria bacterium RBG_13_39_14]